MTSSKKLIPLLAGLVLVIAALIYLSVGWKNASEIRSEVTNSTRALCALTTINAINVSLSIRAINEAMIKQAGLSALPGPAVVLSEKFDAELLAIFGDRNFEETPLDLVADSLKLTQVQGRIAAMDPTLTQHCEKFVSQLESCVPRFSWGAHQLPPVKKCVGERIQAPLKVIRDYAMRNLQPTTPSAVAPVPSKQVTK